MNKDNNILIVGAGLCGSLLALRLAQRGYQVEVYESRPDLRVADISAGKSINLALSSRGFKALRLVGIEEKVKEICIPMYGRLMHDAQGNTFISNYSGQGKYINSISRGDLNGMLLTEADTYDNLTVYFNRECKKVDIENNVATFYNYETKETIEVTGSVIFGTDGASSVVRTSYFLARKFLFNYSQNFLTHGYKELEIPASKKGKHQISKDHLHIWPRGEYMLIALPNLDGSFTVTLFLAHEEGEYNFKGLNSEEKLKDFFQKQFPDALELIPSIADEFANNPTGVLGTIKSSPWYYKNKNLIMGDAAHTVVPFYGQGMNASFEDVTVLDDVIEKYKEELRIDSGAWETVFKEYQNNRQEDGFAIGDLAEENYCEMRDKVTDPIFKKKREIEMQLEEKYKDYSSKYSMVTFNDNIRYSEAMKRGRKQDELLLELCKDSVVDNTSLENIYTQLKAIKLDTDV